VNHMKKQLLKAATILSVVALTITSMVAPAAADSSSAIRVNVPFDFTADHNVLPAGKYTIQSGGVNLNGVIRITSDDGKATVFLLSHSAQSIQSRNETVVIFHRYGDQYFLFQVWAVGDTIGSEIPRSSVERQAEREVDNEKGQSASSAQPAEVVIAAR
ncbi:MAG TPA: hypothetical protein VFB82_14125, partial [Blastocatellia bacterium]|nr:hypothetical protein [Blastocatellia bacterium]